MIPRYSRSQMVELWEPAHRFAIWFDIEIYVCEAMARRALVPHEAVAALQTISRRYNQQRIARIDELERELKHEVVAFLAELAEHAGPPARWLHLGMTSSDLMDTALSVQLKQASDLLLAGLEHLRYVLAQHAHEHRSSLCIGRSHGMHAEPTSFGLKLAGHHAELSRAQHRLEIARSDITYGAISGAVGTFAELDPEIEAEVMQRLGLTPEPISSQIIPRDRHAFYFSVLAIVAASLERLALEIRHLQRSEIGEVAEPFTIKQAGSSAMPHKRNPILSENITGLSRLIRAMASATLENVALWHERDISHSSVERVIAPDITTMLDFAIHRMASVVENLDIHPDVMQQHLESSRGLYASGAILLALTRAGLERSEAYRLVQRASIHVLNHQQLSFSQALKQDPHILTHLDTEMIDHIISESRQSPHLDALFARAFSESHAHKGMIDRDVIDVKSLPSQDVKGYDDR